MIEGLDLVITTSVISFSYKEPVADQWFVSCMDCSSGGSTISAACMTDICMQ